MTNQPTIRDAWEAAKYYRARTGQRATIDVMWSSDPESGDGISIWVHAGEQCVNVQSFAQAVAIFEAKPAGIPTADLSAEMAVEMFA